MLPGIAREHAGLWSVAPIPRSKPGARYRSWPFRPYKPAACTSCVLLLDGSAAAHLLVERQKAESTRQAKFFYDTACLPTLTPLSMPSTARTGVELSPR